MSILLGNWQQVLNYYNKADASLDMSEVRDGRPVVLLVPAMDDLWCLQANKVGGSLQQEIATRLVCAAGVADMAFGKYKSAARLLTKASIENCKFQDVGSSCALLWKRVLTLAPLCSCSLHTRWQCTAVCVPWPPMTDRNFIPTSSLAGSPCLWLIRLLSEVYVSCLHVVCLQFLQAVFRVGATTQRCVAGVSPISLH